MDSLSDIVDWAVRFLTMANEQAAELDGRVAFVLGLLAWLAVEQAIRRITGMLRWTIIVAALGASGVGVAALLGAFDGAALVENVVR